MIHIGLLQFGQYQLTSAIVGQLHFGIFLYCGFWWKRWKNYHFARQCKKTFQLSGLKKILMTFGLKMQKISWQMRNLEVRKRADGSRHLGWTLDKYKWLHFFNHAQQQKLQSLAKPSSSVGHCKQNSISQIHKPFFTTSTNTNPQSFATTFSSANHTLE